MWLLRLSPERVEWPERRRGRSTLTLLWVLWARLAISTSKPLSRPLQDKHYLTLIRLLAVAALPIPLLVCSSGRPVVIFREAPYWYCSLVHAAPLLPTVAPFWLMRAG